MLLNTYVVCFVCASSYINLCWLAILMGYNKGKQHGKI